jgi:hypothetical protein
MKIIQWQFTSVDRSTYTKKSHMVNPLPLVSLAQLLFHVGCSFITPHPLIKHKAPVLTLQQFTPLVTSSLVISHPFNVPMPTHVTLLHTHALVTCRFCLVPLHQVFGAFLYYPLQQFHNPLHILKLQSAFLCHRSFPKMNN